MRDISVESAKALDVIIEGLNYNFFSVDGTHNEDLDTKEIEEYILELEPDKMKRIIESKTSSFDSAKRILDNWMSSPFAPTKKVARDYIERIIYAGDTAIDILRTALGGDIDFSQLDPAKHGAAIRAKPIIYESIFDLDYSLDELKGKLEAEDFNLKEQDFRIGYPERYAKGEFFPITDYYKDWHNEEEDAVKICPHGTEGEIIDIGGLKIQLPKKPKKSEILFSDLPKKEQYWRRTPLPKTISSDNVKMWDEQIKEEYRRRREGVWFMNNGEAVYLTGNMYFALNYCKMIDTGGYMDFRYAQRDIFYHLEACIIDERCLGQLFVKSRRTGFTYIILATMLNHSTGIRNKNFGMTSKSDTDAKKAFLKYRYMLLNLPFYFRPVIKGKLDSPKEFEFATPLKNTLEAKKAKDRVDIDDYLNTTINYLPTKEDSYDGLALYMYLGDEAGKWKKPNDYRKHLGQVTPTMHEGGEIKGKAFIGSTVGAMSKGGEQFKELHRGSNVEERDPITGMTATGLYAYFLPAQDNMTAFIDKYGVCHKIKPEGKVYNVKGKLIKHGSIEYLMSQEEAKRKAGDVALNEQYRAFPRMIEHAFRDEAEDSIFSLTKLYEQLEFNSELPEDKRPVIGNFEWKDGIVDSEVEFHPDPKGRFKISWMPSKADGTAHLQNRVKKVGEKWFPLNVNHVRFGCDPFSYKSTHGKGSKGSIHGKTVSLPDDGIPQNKFILEYIARPSDEFIFFEDVIKCIRFYGAPILIESNRKDLVRHLYNRGYRGFSMDRVDRPPHRLNPDEKKYGGQMMSGPDIIDAHINAIGSWIQSYVGVYSNEEIGLRPMGEMGDFPFNETLKDWIGFNPDERTKFDATISSGLAIMACQPDRYIGKSTEKKDKPKVKTLLKKFNHKGQYGKVIG